MKNIIKFTLSKTKNYYHLIILFVIISFIATVLSVFIPYYTGQFIDFLSAANKENKNITILLKYASILVSAGILGIILGYISNRLNVILSIKTTNSIKRMLVIHLQKSSHLHTSKINTGYLNQRITSDANSLSSFSINLIQNIIVKSLLIIIPALVLFTFSPVITIIFIVFVIIYYILYIILRKKVYKRNLILKERQAEHMSAQLEQLTHISFIKKFGLLFNFINRYDITYSKLFKSTLKYQTTSYSFTAAENLVRILAQIVLFIWGGILVFDGSITIGQFTIMSTYLSIMLNASGFFLGLSKYTQDALVSLDRINELLNMKRDHYGEIDLTSINTIELNNCTFSYGKDILINKFNYKFIKGNIYVITGENGSGKSTLTDIILGIYNSNLHGLLLYNNISAEKLNLIGIQQNNIGYCEQDPTFFKDTLFNNIICGNTSNCKTKMLGLIDYFGLSDLIASLEDGINSYISNKTSFSGGEKYKLSIIRALIKEPDVLILDEPTAALDTQGKCRLVDLLISLKKTKIIIIISHDSKINKIADYVLELSRL